MLILSSITAHVLVGIDIITLLLCGADKLEEDADAY